MTPAQQTAYWRKYAKQNAKMERLAYYIMLRTIRDSLVPVVKSLNTLGVEQTIAQLDGIYTSNIFQEAYIELYQRVGISQKKWADADVKERFSQRKDDRNTRILREFLKPKPTSTPVDGNIELGFFNAQWLERLKRIATGLDVAQRYTSVTDTVREKIKKSLIESQQQFVSISKITAKLKRDIGGLFSVKRAEMIARTEVTHISNIAAEESARETGIDLVKTWIHTRDDRTRDAHRNVPTKPIKSFEKFIVGGVKMDRPGDPAGGLRNIINCRCCIVFLPADDYEDLGF